MPQTLWAIQVLCLGILLLRLDPKDQKQLNLISYAVNYAATVTGSEDWSYAWKGLTGQYPG